MYSKMASIFLLVARVLCFAIFCFNSIFIATYPIVQGSAIQEQYLSNTETEKTVINVSIFRNSYTSNQGNVLSLKLLNYY